MGRHMDKHDRLCTVGFICITNNNGKCKTKSRAEKTQSLCKTEHEKHSNVPIDKGTTKRESVARGRYSMQTNNPREHRDANLMRIDTLLCGPADTDSHCH